ncbi:MAG: hypothetical protein H0U03_10575 [Actinobacteria bacterium]|nr:hypothetical protein [Actinomycetota bacterium]
MDGAQGGQLAWTCDDVREHGTHPSPSGRQKVAAKLLTFFKTNATAKLWFLRR